MVKFVPEHVLLGTLVYTKEDYVLSLMKEITNFECKGMKPSYYQVIKFDNLWAISYVVGNIATYIDDYTDVSKQDIVDFFDKMEIEKIILF